ncbi:HAD family hydrolase [Vibrio intestinalis]|uniref:HAD family hydrolase n=1 Tax=Vibrio intestinalis TaxID=2933291 RepID=UPI0021A6FB40|nr:HAD family hydrolase [Vibrio intestinalis]
MSALTLWKNSPFAKQLELSLSEWVNPHSASYLPPEERVAVFDLDGTLWCEKPEFAEFAFWRSELQQALTQSHHNHHAAILNVLQDIEEDLYVLAAKFAHLYRNVHQGTSSEQYQQRVRNWLSSILHPRFHQPYEKLTYTPMKQVIELLQQHGFRCLIDSGSTDDFVRAFGEELLGIKPEDVLGSQLNLHDVSQSMVLNIGHQKVKQLQQLTTIKPILAVGNTFSDVELIKWAKQREGSLTAFVSHDDDAREYRYHFGPILDIELKTALRNTHQISIKQHWEQVFSFQEILVGKQIETFAV